MPDSECASNWISERLQRDAIKIIALAVILALAGGLAVLREPRATSTAQLVLTTIPVYPENQEEVEDIPSRLLAEPLDVKSATILCTSDETFRRTAAVLGGVSIATLRSSLRCEMSIAEESPMDIVYSPILKLRATTKHPEKAKQYVDVWSAICVEMAREYKAKRQGAIAEAMQNTVDNLLNRIGTARNDNMSEIVGVLTQRAQYAKVGADGNPPELQVLSPGAVWPLTSTWRVAVEGAIAGFLAGLVAGVIVSLGLHCISRFGLATT